VWRLQEYVQGKGSTSPEFKRKLHSCIKKVTGDIESMKFNTAIAAMMSLVNDATAQARMSRDELRTLLLLLSPFAPHICEEMNEQLGFGEQLHHSAWPKWDESVLIEDTMEYGIQINGKVRGRISLPANLPVAEIEAAALNADDILPLLAGKTVRKIIIVRNIINIVAA
jgi:leucyl-tRNA synthetase